MSRRRHLGAAHDAELGNLFMISRTPIDGIGSPSADLSCALYGEGASNRTSSKAPFGIAHHWAMAGPCSMSDRLPALLTVVVNRVEEPTIDQAVSPSSTQSGGEKSIRAQTKKRRAMPAVSLSPKLVSLGSFRCSPP